MSNMPNIERELRAKELQALAAVVEACSKAGAAKEFSNMTREGFLAVAKSATELIDNKLKDMYTNG